MFEKLIIAFWIVFILFCLFGGIITCDAKTNDIGFPHRWSFLGGCQIEVKGNWVPLDNYRNFGD